MRERRARPSRVTYGQTNHAASNTLWACGPGCAIWHKTHPIPTYTTLGAPEYCVNILSSYFHFNRSFHSDEIHFTYTTNTLVYPDYSKIGFTPIAPLRPAYASLFHNLKAGIYSASLNIIWEFPQSIMPPGTIGLSYSAVPIIPLRLIALSQGSKVILRGRNDISRIQGWG